MTSDILRKLLIAGAAIAVFSVAACDDRADAPAPAPAPAPDAAEHVPTGPTDGTQQQ